jgi:phosphohistidine phosphatase
MPTKELYFLRHAIAIDRETSNYNEDERPLTSDGEKKMIQAVWGMKHLKLSLDGILSSPLTRARQTAQLVKDHLPVSHKIEIEETLRPGGSLEDFLKKLKTRKEESLLSVGHEPSMSDWIQTLLGVQGQGLIQMKKGALCHLTLEWRGSRPQARLNFLLPPRVLREMGKGRRS